MDAEQLVFARRHKVCMPSPAVYGDSTTVTRQLDAVLMVAGFKLSGQAMVALSQLDPAQAIDLAVPLIRWAKELTGAHVAHNVYFIDFPANVPDTMDFWLSLIMESVREYAQTGHATVEGGFTQRGEFIINLLSLPGYGAYQHTYAEMLAHHEELVPMMKDRLTIVHLGQSLATEVQSLYGELAASRVPLSGENLDAMRELAGTWDVEVPKDIPVRENRAVINAARLRHGLPLHTSTPTDFLRLAAELAGGDVTLQTPARYKMRRPERRAFMAALNASADRASALVAPDSGRFLADVLPYAEQWKRVGERVKPHEYPQFPLAQQVFAVARGEYPVQTIASDVEAAFAAGNVIAAANWLAVSPGMLWRSADRLLRTVEPAELENVLAIFRVTAPQVSGRVLLSVREHLGNRVRPAGVSRIFTNRAGRAWVAPDRREPLNDVAVSKLTDVIDAQIMARLPDPGHLIIDPAILGAALPLSGKSAPEGLGVFPRGSVVPVGQFELLRFFTYWRQKSERTDFDLSALFTDERFGNDSHLSYTSLRNFGGVHSGDITSAPAPDGATEFIDITLSRIGRGFIIPQVYVFSGEDFSEVDENFFGFMTRDAAQQGQPFEARTVRSKSALFAPGRTAMPLIFYRGEDGAWYAKWLHLYLKGQPSFYGGGFRIEENKVTAKLLARSVYEREYLRVSYLVDMLRAKAVSVRTAFGQDWYDNAAFDMDAVPVTYIGIERPEKLPEGSTVITLENLSGIIPA